MRSIIIHSFLLSKELRKTVYLGSLSVLLIIAIILSLATGVFSISASEIWSIVLYKLNVIDGTQLFSKQQEVILWNIRLPRVLLAVLIGGALGVSGASLQGLFRNPLVEPGLIGVSGGAALFAAIAIIFGGSVSFLSSLALPGSYFVSTCAFAGALLASIIVFYIGGTGSGSSVSILILAGVAINALCMALIGLCIYYANDESIRQFTFWSLGDLGGASWERIGLSIPLILLPSLALLRFQRALNAFALGENEAYHLGIKVKTIRIWIIALVALAVGSAVAVAGSIGFIGLVVPHMLRAVLGPDHSFILPGSLLFGALLLLLADLLARTIVAPSEIPIGVITALLGAPFFLGLLIQAKRKNTL